MSESTNPMDALNALMEERNRYEQWLAQLDARKGTTPPHVFERVRGDYGERLDEGARSARRSRDGAAGDRRARSRSASRRCTPTRRRCGTSAPKPSFARRSVSSRSSMRVR